VNPYRKGRMIWPPDTSERSILDPTTLSSTRVVVLTPFRPNPEGHGGDHRTYQIWHDAAQIVGEKAVTVFSRSVSRPRGDSSPIAEASISGPQVIAADEQPDARSLHGAVRLARMAVRNPLKAFSRSRTSPVYHWSRSLLAKYKEFIRRCGADLICIVEHIGFSDYISINKTLGIRTIAAPQNCESLDEGYIFSRGYLGTMGRLVDLAQEARALSICEWRLAISPTECALFNAIVGETSLYPYRVVGRLEEWTARIRRERELRRRGAAQQILLAIGSATHEPTRAGLTWLLDNALRFGLPAQTVLVVAGHKTEGLKTPREREADNIRVLGYVSTQHLTELLNQASVALIPHFQGMGSLTRLVELQAAGVPIIASEHAGISCGLCLQSGLGRDWGRWLEEIVRVLRDNREDAFAIGTPTRSGLSPLQHLLVAARSSANN